MTEIASCAPRQAGGAECHSSADESPAHASVSPSGAGGGRLSASHRPPRVGLNARLRAACEHARRSSKPGPATAEAPSRPDSPQGSGDHGPHWPGSRLSRFVKGVLEPVQAFSHMLDLVEIVQERRLLRRLGKPHALHPQEMSLGPGIHPGGWAPPVPQQKLPYPMARAQLIFLRRLSGTHHVSQRFVRGVGHPHRRQGTCAVAPCQALTPLYVTRVQAAWMSSWRARKSVMTRW